VSSAITKAAGVPWAPLVVAAFGIAEVTAGTAGALFGGRAALTVAACYLALTVFAFRLLRRAPATPCACLGSSRAPVTRVHVVLDAMATAAAVVAASTGSPWAQFSGHWAGALPFIVLVGCCIGLASLALESLPLLAAATKEGYS
jgi:hypothetical protein